MRARQGEARKNSTPPSRGARAAGTEVLNLPLMNKGTAFTEDERGVVASGARRVTDGMMLAAGRVLGDYSPARKDPSGSLLPRLRDVRAVARAIATAVGLEAQRAGVAPTTSEAELRQRVATQWTPVYPS